MAPANALPGSYNNDEAPYIDSQEPFDELDNYLSNNRLRQPVDGDIILWWHARANDYPVLSQWALTLHSAPPMSAALERVFSSVGHTITSTRNRLNITTVKALECLRSWRRADKDVRKEREAKRQRRQERIVNQQQFSRKIANIDSDYTGHVSSPAPIRPTARGKGTASQPEQLD